MDAWFEGTATRADVVLIAFVVAFVVGGLAGLGAESAAKSYARELIERICGRDKGAL